MILINRGVPSETLENMLNIKNNSPEWLSVPSTDSKKMRVMFDDDSSLKMQIRRELHIVQKGLCAYCMAKISLTPTNPDEKIKIEHYKPISNQTNPNCKAGVFDYNNYFLVCSGGDGQGYSNPKMKLCCDSKKGNNLITIDPTNQEHINCIGYLNSGIIYFNTSNPNDQILFEKDINETLGLNGSLHRTNDCLRYDTRTRLVERRKDALNAAKNKILLLKTKGMLKKDKIIELIKREESNPCEFSGVYLFYYKSILRNCCEKSEN